jgi:hypothetical protein
MHSSFMETKTPLATLTGVVKSTLPLLRIEVKAIRGTET